jgi:hypothetical protein
MFALIFIGFLWMLGKVVARWTLQSMSEEEREMRLAKFDNTLLSRVLLFLYLVRAPNRVPLLRLRRNAHARA